MTEVEACEVLRQHPHPNIAQYLGVVVKGGRVGGLVFDRYSVTLEELLEQQTPFDRERCLREIEDRIRHMHSLGLVHNDLNPANVMLDNDGKAVIIDFDSCKRDGKNWAPRRAQMDGRWMTPRIHDRRMISTAWKSYGLLWLNKRHFLSSILFHVSTLCQPTSNLEFSVPPSLWSPGVALL